MRLVGTAFYSKVVPLRRMRKKILIILQIVSVNTQIDSIKTLDPLFFVSRSMHLSCQISNESVRKIVICSLNVLMTYDAVFKVLPNIITICVFIAQ